MRGINVMEEALKKSGLDGEDGSSNSKETQQMPVDSFSSEIQEELVNGAPVKFRGSTYRMAGHMKMISVLLAEPTASKLNKRELSISQSCMPFGNNGDVLDVRPEMAALDLKSSGDPSLIISYPCPDVRTAFTDQRSFTKLYPSLETWARKQNKVAVGATMFWRPNEDFNRITGEVDSKMSVVNLKNRLLPLEERLLIDIAGLERQWAITAIMDLACEIISDARLKVPDITPYPARYAAIMLLQDFPFVIQHIFSRLPALRVLRTMANVMGKDVNVYHYRYRPEWVYLSDSMQVMMMPDNNYTIIP